MRRNNSSVPFSLFETVAFGVLLLFYNMAVQAVAAWKSLLIILIAANIIGRHNILNVGFARN